MANSQISANDVAAIRASIEAYASSAVAGDWDEWLALFAENAVFLPPAAPIIAGHNGIRRFVDNFPDLSIFNATPIDIVGDGDLAVSRGEYSLSFTAPGSEVVCENGKFVWVWQREPNGVWRITQDIWNTDA